ncbi:CrcB-like protein-domain-containing protein [Gigaspora margarita]|uniref:CrcB-like protein-domain-containing protein n=1 Tax=Gigaspora margarita TaxID=4874 RepID=A0A8H3WZZ3_GIGMA|nr:CrcB-like protein-domain-containing protein [Gigaspora margarita]
MEIIEDNSTATTVQNGDSDTTFVVSTSNTTDVNFHGIVKEETANKHNPTINLVERHAITIAILIPFSIIGVLIRLGLIQLHTYQGAPVFALIYPQFVGCTIFGFCLARKWFIMERYLPLYVGLQTGLCGSITTFSSWMLLTFQDFENTPNYFRGGIYDFLAGLADIGITIGMSIVGLKFGEQLADVFMPNQKTPNKTIHKITVKSSTMKGFTLLDWVCVASGCASLVLIITLAATIQVHQRILFAIVFAPIGTLTRWQLSRFNSSMSSFPIGTFIANVCGSATLGVLFLLRNGTVYSGIKCETLIGLSDGFCGCLTTISTFTSEIIILPRRHAYKYALTSIVTGQVAMIFLVGIYSWINHGLITTCN